jgi:tRNA threonylcarbamoyl adenosine modification protein (Sua5/YciO/YrdC/YwlC family)
MRLFVHPDNPSARHIKIIIDCLIKGGVIIYPTDSIYGLGCDILQRKAVERICHIRKIDPSKANLSFICPNLSDLSRFTKPISTPLFRMLKQYLPGPYTFILPASKEVPDMLQTKKKTIGLRVPDHAVPIAIANALGRPLLSASLHGDNVEWYTDPDAIEETYGKLVDLIIDTGIGGMIPSAIIDATTNELKILREGPKPFLEA